MVTVHTTIARPARPQLGYTFLPGCYNAIAITLNSSRSACMIRGMLNRFNRADQLPNYQVTAAHMDE